MDWKGKVVFLTGASSGIGEGIALALAKKGATLGLLARREELLKDLAVRCEAAGGAARVFAADVTDYDAVRSAADALRNEFGFIDVLIANAGIGGNSSDTRALQPQAVKTLVDINFLGAAYSVHAVLPEMLERGSGHLVAVSSLAGLRGLPLSAAYSGSKAGMAAFFESVRIDVQDRGVAVTIIYPGFIKTPLTSGREARMPFIMELDDAVPHFIRAIESRKKFAYFPWQLASVARLGKFFPAWLYDRIAGRAKYRA